MKKMVEIHGHFKKGLAEKLAEKLNGYENIHALTVEAGRAGDLFDFNEFGAASEVDIVSLMVDADMAEQVFADVYELAGLHEQRNGMLCMTKPTLHSSLA